MTASSCGGPSGGLAASSAGGPVEVADALERVLDSLGAPPSDLLSTVFGRWEEVVGADVARHCRPVAVEGDRLVVVASDPVWASEVRWLADRVLERVNDLSATDRLTSVAVRVGSAAASSGSASTIDGAPR